MNTQTMTSRPHVRPLAYFMVQLDVRFEAQRQPTEGQALSGVVERLGTGDKRPFGSADELARLLWQWQCAMAAPANREE